MNKLRGLKALKRLSPAALQGIADEIRRFLVRSLSDTGGHLASNLGVVELTVALHAVFSTPRDKIVWDVGHQAYVHKILTGRMGRFGGLRKMGGLSGFPKMSESVHDAFGTGHSSTAISAALGLAVARDLRRAETGAARSPKESVVAVVGDGSITGGLAYEGLNNAGRANTDLLVILNDNQMSISKNVGAVARHLNMLRTAQAYVGAKEDVRSFLEKLPLVGAPLKRGIEGVKDILKYVLLPGVLFEEMGFKYIGPVDGHDTAALLQVLRQVKRLKGPVLMHVLTTKGKGYKNAEKSPRSYHGIGSFNAKTGAPAPKADITYTDIFAREICRHAARDERVVAITAAMPDGTGLSNFKARYPKRFFDVGIAEGHAVTFAAGLAAGGLRPVVAVYSSFLQRAYDQIIHDVAVQSLPVVFAIGHAGAVPCDGETHQGIYDMAFLSHIPNMTVLAPSGGAELKQMLAYALAHDGPVAIRYPKEAAYDGCAAVPEAGGLHDCEKIAIVSVGTMLQTAKAVAQRLTGEGYAAECLDARFVKPVCPGLIKRLAGFEYVFTIEDGVQTGGFGERLLGEISRAPRIVSHAFAFPDIFPGTGTRDELFARYGLDAESIFKKIIKEISNGKQKKTQSGN